MPDNEGAILTALGELKAGNDYTRETLVEIKTEQREQNSTSRRIESEIATQGERLSGHMTEDDRRFVELGEDITRAHRKIAAGSPITTFEDIPPQAHRQTSVAEKGTIAALGTAIVTAIGAAMVKVFGGGGTTPQ